MKLFKISTLIVPWLIGASAWTGLVHASDEGLLGVNVGYPKVSFLSTSSQIASFDGSTMTLVAETTFVKFGAADNPVFVSGGGVFTLSVAVDAAGDIVPAPGNTYSLSGTVGATGYSGTLLQGAVSDFGFYNSPGSSTDTVDFRLTVTGGSMAGLFATAETGATISLEGSDFGGFDSPWGALTVKSIDFGPIPDPVSSSGTGTIGYWKNHPEAWPVLSLSIAGVTLSQADAISVLKTPTRGDKTVSMAKQLIATLLNIAGGNEASCIQDTADAADFWLMEHGGIGSSQRQWDDGDLLHDDLDAYNNGLLCAPHRD